MLERLLVIVPTYNEATNLPQIVPAILKQDPRLEVLVVDDNSPDGTGDIADRMAQTKTRVHVLHRQAKEGLGRAYLAGFQWGLDQGYQAMFEMDADFSHDPAFLPRFLVAIEEADNSGGLSGAITVRVQCSGVFSFAKTGGGTFTGAFLGKNLTVNNGASVRYDETLRAR